MSVVYRLSLPLALVILAGATLGGAEEVADPFTKTTTELQALRPLPRDAEAAHADSPLGGLTPNAPEIESRSESSSSTLSSTDRQAANAALVRQLEQQQKTASWLLDALLRGDAEASQSETARALPSEARREIETQARLLGVELPAEQDDPSTLGARHRTTPVGFSSETQSSQRDQSRAPASVNPLDPFLAGWLRPGDLVLLQQAGAIQAPSGAAAGTRSDQATNPSASGHWDAPVSSTSGFTAPLNLDFTNSPINRPTTASSSENPFLAGLALSSPADLTLPAPPRSGGAPSPASLPMPSGSGYPSPASESTGTLPASSHLPLKTDNDKYFPQARRF